MLGDSRSRIRRQAVSIGLALAPFGLAFGVACQRAGLQWWEAAGFSALVFTGSAQFAAVGVLADGGSAAAAIAAGTLLNIRSLAFGLILAPYLSGPRWWRALVSHGMIDESTAVALSQDDPVLRRYGYLVGASSVFTSWNTATLVGFLAVGSSGSTITKWGLDATIPAAFLALLWPRLDSPGRRRTAAAGILIAALLVPFSPPGVPIIAASCGVFASGRNP
jgi:predicted branched-subunit amino acid permease